jgi:hypothetical protein
MSGITRQEKSGDPLFPLATSVIYTDSSGATFTAAYLRPTGGGLHRISIERPAPGGFRKEVRHVRGNRIALSTHP